MPELKHAHQKRMNQVCVSELIPWPDQMKSIHLGQKDNG